MDQEKKQRSNAVKIVRLALTVEPKTFGQVKSSCDGLKDGQISMSLCYLLRKGEIARERSERTAKYGRKEVFTYFTKGKDEEAK